MCPVIGHEEILSMFEIGLELPSVISITVTLPVDEIAAIIMWATMAKNGLILIFWNLVFVDYGIRWWKEVLYAKHRTDDRGKEG